MERLASGEVRNRIKGLDGWKLYRTKAITRKFLFSDFKSAMKFANSLGKEAEKAQHHPDIIIQNFCELICRISTHAVGGVTQKDIDLAKRVNNLYDSMKYGKK